MTLEQWILLAVVVWVLIVLLFVMVWSAWWRLFKRVWRDD